jgi:hypothetical protein
LLLRARVSTRARIRWSAMTRWPLIAVLLAGCPLYSRRPDPPKAPKTPVAIAGINSPFDDFNSADMSMYRLHRFAFSSNRGSEGKQFDIYDTQLSWTNDKLVSAIEPVVFLPTLMSEQDERGPIAFGSYDWDDSYGDTWLAWSSDREGGAGGFDLYALACSGSWKGHRELPCADMNANAKATDSPTSAPAATMPELVPLAGLASPRDDAYLSKPFAPRRVLFASNRESVSAASMTAMDIYTASWADKTKLTDAPVAVARVAELSSDADDTAPFVWRSMDHAVPVEMVFVSDRPGGHGEHDIYCSRYDAKADRWSAPKNLGRSINSAKDEYRPIVFELNSTRFLVFSSTRDGGQGGYDLYVVGYPGCPRG